MAFEGQATAGAAPPSSAHPSCPAGACLGVPWGARGLCCGNVRRKGTSQTPDSAAALIPCGKSDVCKSRLWEDPARWVHCEAGAEGPSGRQAQPRSDSRVSTSFE